MPKTMRVKIFKDTDTGALEARINEWLDHLGTAVVIKLETVVTSIAGKANDGTDPCIVVTVWYEPPSD